MGEEIAGPVSDTLRHDLLLKLKYFIVKYFAEKEYNSYIWAVIDTQSVLFLSKLNDRNIRKIANTGTWDGSRPSGLYDMRSLGSRNSNQCFLTIFYLINKYRNMNGHRNFLSAHTAGGVLSAAMSVGCPTAYFTSCKLSYEEFK